LTRTGVCVSHYADGPPRIPVRTAVCPSKQFKEPSRSKVEAAQLAICRRLLCSVQNHPHTVLHIDRVVFREMRGVQHGNTGLFTAVCTVRFYSSFLRMREISLSFDRCSDVRGQHPACQAPLPRPRCALE